MESLHAEFSPKPATMYLRSSARKHYFFLAIPPIKSPYHLEMIGRVLKESLSTQSHLGTRKHGYILPWQPSSLESMRFRQQTCMDVDVDFSLVCHILITNHGSPNLSSLLPWCQTKSDKIRAAASTHTFLLYIGWLLQTRHSNCLHGVERIWKYVGHSSSSSSKVRLDQSRKDPKRRPHPLWFPSGTASGILAASACPARSQGPALSSAARKPLPGVGVLSQTSMNHCDFGFGSFSQQRT